VLLGGHLGLRPLEIRAVPWSALADQTLTVGRSHTKATARRMRTIAVPATTAHELREWRLRSGRPADREPIIGAMTPNALKLWGAKRLRPAVKAATEGRIEDATVYTLRHSHASALHYSGHTVPEAAKRLGHGGETHLRVYAHVIEALSGERWADLDALIAAARAELGAWLLTRVGSQVADERESPR
jgi:integrase